MKRVNILEIILGSILLLSLTGCGPSGTLSADSTVDRSQRDVNTDRLEGSSWMLYSYNKNLLMEGTSFTLNFEAGQAQGNAGCNRFFGSYTEDQNRIALSNLGMTAMACLEPEGLMDQEQDLLAFLGKGETLELSDGRLLISTANGETLIFESLK